MEKQFNIKEYIEAHFKGRVAVKLVENLNKDGQKLHYRSHGTKSKNPLVELELDADLFSKADQEIADHFIKLLTTKNNTPYQKALDKYIIAYYTAYHKERVKKVKLAFGDRIELSTGESATYLKMELGKLLVNNLSGEEDARAQYTFHCQAFVKIISKYEPDPRKEEIRALVKKFKGQEIQTSWGPSVVKGLSDDRESVELLEFGEEFYTLKLEDFYDEIKNLNS